MSNKVPFARRVQANKRVRSLVRISKLNYAIKTLFKQEIIRELHTLPSSIVVISSSLSLSKSAKASLRQSTSWVVIWRSKLRLLEGAPAMAEIYVWNNSIVSVKNDYSRINKVTELRKVMRRSVSGFLLLECSWTNIFLYINNLTFK